MRLILRQVRLREVKNFVQGHMVKGRLGLDQRAGLAASGDLGFPHILEHLQGVCVCVCVCVCTNKYSLSWSNLLWSPK